MSKIESVQTQDEILKYVGMDTVIGRMITCNVPANTHVSDQQYLVDQLGIRNFYEQRTDDCRAIFSGNLSLTRHNKNGRICGYVYGENDDGSLKISLMGNSSFNTGGNSCVFSGMLLRARGNTWITPGDPDSLTRKMVGNSGINPQFVTDTSLVPDIYGQNATFYVNYNDGMMYLTPDVVLADIYKPQWSNAQAGRNSYTANFMRYNNNYLENYTVDVNLTTNSETTLKLNVPFENVTFLPLESITYEMGYNNVGGDVYAICFNIIDDMCQYLGGVNEFQFPASLVGDFTFDAPIVGSYSAFGKLFNTVLTRNKNEAIAYINNGVLPSDAFLYPFDVDNIPTNDNGRTPIDPDDVPKDDNPNEDDGDPDDDITSTPPSRPNSLPQSLTNNNLYWLLDLQLKNFIDWFWTDATSIASAGDLWDKIRGLYDNLSTAIINIRYMPVREEWIGGTTLDDSIIVGMIEKAGQVLAINKTVPNLRPIGEIEIDEFYNSFCDYAPYTDVRLYLPFHGFIDLDTNFLMGHKLKVYCYYDVTSGTVQYLIYRDSALINTCISKMAVDIPITLQTKNERDSTIFQNVANSVSSLMSAGMSVASANPIGLVMSMGNIVGSQTHGVPMSVKGTVGESGSFFAPNRCAIYIKNPKYNKPTSATIDYASQVGYPCNGIYTLKKGIGYAQVYNPKIIFNGNKYEQTNNKMLPLESEIQEIYDVLEKGVIL